MSKSARKAADQAEREKVHKRYSNRREPDVIYPARKQVDFYDADVHQRVAVYVRVSTDNLGQETSYELQKNYYEEFVLKHPNWTLVKIYADKGISGTSTKHRVALNQMLADSRAGKIDLIIRQHKIREDLILKESARILLWQVMRRADVDKVLIGRDGIVLFPGIHNVNRRNKFQRFRREVLADAAVLFTCTAGELYRAIPHMVGKALLFVQRGCQYLIEALLGIRSAIAFEQAARIVNDQPFFNEAALQSGIWRIEMRRRSFWQATKSIGEWTDVFPRQFAAVRPDPIVVRQAETEVSHEQALRGGNAFLLQKRGDIALTDGDGTAQPPFAQTVCALTAAERQQLRIRAGRDLEDSAGQIIELQGRNNIVFVHQIISLLCHVRHLPAFSVSSIS